MWCSKNVLALFWNRFVFVFLFWNATEDSLLCGSDTMLEASAIMGNRVIALPQNRLWTEQMRVVLYSWRQIRKRMEEMFFSLNSCSIHFLTTMKSTKSLVWLNCCASPVGIKYNNCFLNWLFECSSLLWTRYSITSCCLSLLHKCT